MLVININFSIFEFIFHSIKLRLREATNIFCINKGTFFNCGNDNGLSARSKVVNGPKLELSFMWIQYLALFCNLLLGHNTKIKLHFGSDASLAVSWNCSKNGFWVSQKVFRYQKQNSEAVELDQNLEFISKISTEHWTMKILYGFEFRNSIHQILCGESNGFVP